MAETRNWLQRQFDIAEAEVAKWPAWKRRELDYWMNERTHETAPASRRSAMMTQGERAWRPIETAPKEDRVLVDLWMRVHASPRSFGFSDEFRVPDAYRIRGKWFHMYRGEETELYEAYITHWMPIQEPPQ